MSSNYTITLTNGAVLGEVHPLEINGGTSTPRQIQGVNVTDFELIGDLTSRFVAGFQFSVNSSAGAANDGLYVVDVGGSTFNGTHTIIPVTITIPSLALPFGDISYELPSSEVLSSLDLVGRGNLNFGELMINSTVHLLENFANTTQPLNPLEGQLWYDTANSSLQVFDSVSFTPVSGAGSAWGSISGTLTDQLDLNAALLLKSDTSHTHDSAYVNITGDTMSGTLVIASLTESLLELHDAGVAPSKISFFDNTALERGLIAQDGDALYIVNQNGTTPDINLISPTAIKVNDVIFPSRAATINFPADNGNAGEVLTTDGNNDMTWSEMPAPGYELIEATTVGQVVFTTTIPTATNVSGGSAALMVYVSGVLQLEGATESYTVTGLNEITFNGGLSIGTKVVLYSF